MNKIFSILEKYSSFGELTQEEVDELAFTDLEMYYNEFNNSSWWNFVWGVNEVVISFLEEKGEEYDDFDEEYPSDPYHFGYSYNDKVYIIGYTGVAGKYWNGEESFYICKPW